MDIRFVNRAEAGRYLATKLMHYANRPDVLVLALPRGGVPVAFEVAQALDAPLDVFIVRKLGLPGHEELAIGAVATGGVSVFSSELISDMRLSRAEVESVVASEQAELERRERLYRGDRPLPDVHGRTVILVDDGLATGASMWAAVIALKKLEPARIVVAVPTASPATCAQFEHEVDEVICAITPEPFYAVGLWYEHFDQTTDDEVRTLLERSRQERKSEGDKIAAPGV